MIKVGTLVKLKVPCLGNEIGTVGVCYEEYQLNGNGRSIIFENGNYDGFSEDEQESFLEVVGTYPLLETYQFKNVMQLSWDYDSGVFDIIKRKDVKEA